jgi:uncharacterized protein (DUF58 family)
MSVGSTHTVERLREQAEAIGRRLPSLLVEAERVAATVAQGVHGRRRTGIGEAFWQFRAYQVGDEPRAIDWRQSGKSQHVFVREQEWEAAESVWLWADLSPSMRFRSGGNLPFKVDRSLLLTFALAALLVRGGERVAFLGSGERPRGGRLGIRHLARTITQTIDRQDERLPPIDRLPRYARLVLISDFLEPVDEIGRRLAAFTTTGVEGVILQVTDPAEEELPYAGRVLFQGLEKEGNALIRNVGSVRRRYQDAFQAQRQALTRLAGRQGWRLATHRTDRSAESGLLALYQMLAPRAIR